MNKSVAIGQEPRLYRQATCQCAHSQAPSKTRAPFVSASDLLRRSSFISSVRFPLPQTCGRWWWRMACICRHPRAGACTRLSGIPVPCWNRQNRHSRNAFLIRSSWPEDTFLGVRRYILLRTGLRPRWYGCPCKQYPPQLSKVGVKIFLGAWHKY